MVREYIIIAVSVIIAVLIAAFFKFYFMEEKIEEVKLEEKGAEEIPKEEEKEEEIIEEVTNETANETDEIMEPETEEIENIHYTFSNYISGRPIMEVFISGNNRKYILPNIEHFNKKPYNTIYMDYKRGIAIGFCELPGCAVKDKGVLLIFSEYDIDVPEDYLKLVEGAEEKEGTVIDGRSTIYKETEEVRVWIDKYYGLPLRVKFIEDKGEIYFGYIDVNNPNLYILPKYGFTWK